MAEVHRNRIFAKNDLAFGILGYGRALPEGVSDVLDNHLLIVCLCAACVSYHPLAAT